MANIPLLVTKLTLASSTSSYVGLGSFKIYDGANVPYIPTNIVYPSGASKDVAYATFTMGGITGNTVKAKNSPTTSAYHDMKNFITGVSATGSIYCHDCTNTVITFAQPLLITRITLKAGSSSAQQIKITADTSPAFASQSKSFSVAGSTYGSGKITVSVDYGFTSLPKVKAYKVPYTEEAERKYYFLLPKVSE